MQYVRNAREAKAEKSRAQAAGKVVWRPVQQQCRVEPGRCSGEVCRHHGVEGEERGRRQRCRGGRQAVRWAGKVAVANHRCVFHAERGAGRQRVR